MHGCAQELRDLLDEVRFDSAADNLVLVGDLVNKGPASAEVVVLCRSLGALAVRGNHEDRALDHRARWEEGGRDGKMLKAKHRWVAELSDGDVEWLRALPYTLRLEAHRMLVVHAGLVPGRALEAQQEETMTTVRNIVREAGEGGAMVANKDVGMGEDAAWYTAWNAYVGGNAIPGRLPGAGGADEVQEWHVCYGHDALRGLTRRRLTTGLDSACVYGGHLSAMLLQPGERASEEAKVIRVPARKVYDQPKSKPRR